uniref:Mitochondrial import receptor subunit TOM22 homolog n=1 Tax=Phallusia mammillata TaxID=59560 RepID=A0A6F9DUP6_9ASCI|nr:mitochondrial import receptor subunit TOM22 homolog [Phallusia mammillata]
MGEVLKQLEEEVIEDFEDETLYERLWGLTEMFPDSLRNATAKSADYTVLGTKKLYRFVRSAMWVGTTGFMILVVPIVFEQERFNMEQQQQQHQRQILLGPTAAVSGVPSGMGMAPPPPSR